MTDISNYLGDALLNWFKGTAFPSAPSTVYASLWNGDPDAGGTEVTGTVNLTRQAVSLGTVSLHALLNNADITFGTASGAATVTYVAVHDAASSGNLLWRHNISSVSIANANVIKILNGNVTINH